MVSFRCVILYTAAEACSSGMLNEGDCSILITHRSSWSLCVGQAFPHGVSLSKAWCTLRAKSEANNRNMTSKQQRTGANILLLRYLFASLRYFALSVHVPLGLGMVQKDELRMVFILV